MADVQGPWTIGRLLDWTTKHFRARNIESARLDAEVLLAHALGGVPRIQLYTGSEDVASDAVRTRYRDLITQRVDGCPVAYLVGSREFNTLTFEVTRDVLIPRGDTETLVMECLTLARKIPDARFLDIGTGSGCVAVSLVHRRKDGRAVATDISPAALAVARRNAERHKVAERIDFREGDLFAALGVGERFHFVVSNPPYVDPEELRGLAREVRDFEPHLALDGGPGGLSVYDRLVPAALPVLEPSGWLLVEIGYNQEEAVRQRFAAAGYTDIRTAQDAANLPRVILGRKPSG